MFVGLTCISIIVFAPQTAGADVEADPLACDCNTIEVSDQEAAKGCPSEDKQEICALDDQLKKWKERLRLEQQRHRREPFTAVPRVSR